MVEVQLLVNEGNIIWIDDSRYLDLLNKYWVDHTKQNFFYNVYIDLEDEDIPLTSELSWDDQVEELKQIVDDLKIKYVLEKGNENE